MKVDFCPALCITEKPILRAFGAFSHFVWYRGVSSNYSETAREKEPLPDKEKDQMAW